MNLRETYEKSKTISIKDGGLGLILEKIVQEIEEMTTPSVSIRFDEQGLIEIYNALKEFQENHGIQNSIQNSYTMQSIENALQMFKNQKNEKLTNHLKKE